MAAEPKLILSPPSLPRQAVSLFFKAAGVHKDHHAEDLVLAVDIVSICLRYLSPKASLKLMTVSRCPLSQIERMGSVPAFTVSFSNIRTDPNTSVY